MSFYSVFRLCIDLNKTTDDCSETRSMLAFSYSLFAQGPSCPYAVQKGSLLRRTGRSIPNFLGPAMIYHIQFMRLRKAKAAP